jgi:hypothetical protein
MKAGRPFQGYLSKMISSAEFPNCEISGNDNSEESDAT